MTKRALVLAAAGLLAAGCGSRQSSPPSTATVHTVPAAQQMPLTVFRVRGGVLRPRVVHVQRTRAVAAAALRALGVPAPVTIAHGTATVGLARATDEKVAEIVYTLTQFPSVRRVDVAGRSGLTRATIGLYVVPPILVERPAAGARVPATFRVSGTASVFEATLVVEAVRGGEVLDRQTVTATEGAPGRGTFETTLRATAGRATVRAYAPSAADGRPQHEVDVEVEVTP